MTFYKDGRGTADHISRTLEGGGTFADYVDIFDIGGVVVLGFGVLL